MLRRLLTGEASSIDPDSDAATAINMLNLFVQSTPRMSVRPTLGNLLINVDVTVGVM
ncbi:hypothetical protein H0H81_002910 [Sphagnurus paluster]|uniref:Argonaute linker 1 domain-containing protein n=1 Tax=Sphagnurus paluster TaxID=117069 RepID=A0A9P7GGI6_9AGAR|nr:hypothetical protein H0H81_002910 [Sphagnurus paluster]